MSDGEMKGVYGLLGNRAISEGIIVSLVLQLHCWLPDPDHHDNKRSKAYSKLYSWSLLHM